MLRRFVYRWRANLVSRRAHAKIAIDRRSTLFANYENIMKLNIRPATMTDAPMIADLLANIDDYPHWKTLGVAALEAAARESLAWANSERLLFVAEIDHRVVGYAAVYWLKPMFSAREGYVSELFIRSDASGHGAGTALLNAVKSAAIARGCHRLTLVNLKDRESYKRGFYASRGWEEQSNTVRFSFDLETASKKNSPT